MSVEKQEGRFDRKLNRAVAYHTYTGDVKVLDAGKAADIATATAAIGSAAAVSVTVFRRPDHSAKTAVAAVGIAISEPPCVVVLRTVTPDARCEANALFTKALAASTGPKYILAGDSSSDGKKFKEAFGMDLSDLKGTVILSAEARKKGVKSSDYQDLASNFGYYVEIPPYLANSNWEADALSEGQVKFAADHSWFQLAVGKKIEAAEKEKPKKEKESAPEKGKGKGKEKGKGKGKGKAAPAEGEKAKPTWTSVGKINPDSTGLNLEVTVVSKGATESKGAGKGDIAEAVVGDASAVVTMMLNDDQIQKVSVGSALILRNAAVKMRKGFVRLVVDRWGKIEVATEKPKYTVNKGKDMSATEYELVAL